MAQKTQTQEGGVTIAPINLQTIKLTIIGDTSLICHRFSDKNKKEMLDKQMKVAQKAKAARDPQREYEESLYVHPDGGYGFPAAAFKEAAVAACRQIDDLDMTRAKGLFQVLGELVRITGTPRMREDTVRLAAGSTDLRYRAEFPEWSTELTIRYNASVLSLEQLVNLFVIGGFCSGVGDWRPSSPKCKSGNHGMFHVA